MAEVTLGADAPALDDAAAEMSFGQQRLWMLDRLLPDKSVYNETTMVRLAGALDLPALERALTEIVRRHEVLRTRYVVVDGEPRQLIGDAPPLSLVAEDFTALPEAERQAEARCRAAAVAARPFDLARAAPFRVALLRLAHDEHWLLMTLHHLITDRWSTAVLATELSALYGAFVRGEPSPLPELPVQYADFAAWQRQRLRGELLTRHLDYWRHALAGVPVLALPTDRPRPAVADYAGGQLSFELDAPLTQAVKALARREGATLFMLLLAAFQVLLYRHSGQPDIAVGVSTAGRSRTELESLIGFFVSTIVLRGDLTGAPGFAAYLARVRSTALAAYAHQEVPFEKLVEQLAPARDLSRNPLFQVSFALQNSPGAEWDLPGIDATRIEGIANETAKFDLTFALREDNGVLVGRAQYATSLFDAATIERMIGHYRNLLEGIAADPSCPVDALPLLSPGERHDVLHRWNDTAVDCAADPCIAQAFEAQARRTPDAVALSCAGQRIAYAELNARANRLARHLRAQGVGRDTLVGLCLERSPALVVGMLAILKSGAAFVPLDPAYPAERLAFMLADTAAPVLLTEERLAAGLPAFAGITFRLDADWPALAAQPDTDPPAVATAADLAYVIYTSGSTGRPKGVMIEQRSLMNYMRWTLDSYYREHRGGSPVVHSIAFDGVITTLFGPLLCGQTLDLLRPYREVDALGAGPPASGVYALTKVTPSHLKLVNQQLACADAAAPTAALMIGGEALVPKDIAFWQRRYPGVRLINHYGPTEATVGCCTFEIDAPVDGLAGIPIGYPIRNARLYVLDAQLAPVPLGVIGELWVAGAGVARGYLRRPDLTAERFLDDPFHPAGGRMYRTGDRARRRADGAIELFGRNDQQVKIRGFRVELPEIEAALLQHPGVRQAVVQAHAAGGVADAGVALVAYVVLRGAGAPPARELRQFLKASLPDYMVPGAYVALDALPVTANGKVDRGALPAPTVQDAGVGAGFVAPRDALEARIAVAWTKILALERADVQRDFFDLGGHSLLAMQLLARLEAELGAEVNVREFFAEPTIEGLARLFAVPLARQSAETGPRAAASEPIRANARVPVTRAAGRDAE